MKIEDILEKLLDKRRYNRVNCIDISENEANILLDYITTLQRKEYNNSKAIEKLEKEKETLIKTTKRYEKIALNISNYVKQNCEIIRHKDYDEIGKVNGGHILYMLKGE